MRPDLTLLLDLPVEVGLQRRAGAGAANHFDTEAVAFHERVRAGFLELAREGGDTWRVIDASRDFDAVLRDAVASLSPIL